MPQFFDSWQLVLLLPAAVAGVFGFVLGWLRWRFRHVEVAQTEWDDLVAARQEYLADVREQRRRVAHLEDQRNELLSRVDAAEEKMMEIHARARGAADQLRVATGERDAYRKEFDTAVSWLEEVTAERDKLASREDQAREVVEQHQRARKRVAAMAEEIDRLNDAVRASEQRAVDARAAQVGNHFVELQRTQESLRNAGATIAAMSGEIEELRLREVSRSEEYDTRRAFTDSIDAASDRADLVSANQRLMQLESLLTDSSSRIGQLETDLADAQHEAAHKAATISSLHAELAGAEASMESLRLQLGGAIRDSAELAGAKGELDLASQRVRELATELAAERERTILLEGQLAGSEALIDQLTRQLGVDPMGGPKGPGGLKDPVKASTASNVVDLRPHHERPLVDPAG